jgi:uridylate kinase
VLPCRADMANSSSLHSNSQKAVFFKQSGELLTTKGSGELWTPAGTRETGDKIARVYRVRDEIGVSAITLVSGAGNVIRGNGLKRQGIAGSEADRLGRLGTIMNTIAIDHALRDAKVPVQRFIATGMSFTDMGQEQFAPYNIDDIQEAHDQGRVVLIAGGTGEDNVTTDHAVMWYGHDYALASPDSEVTVLKGTKHDGVYETDPDKSTTAKKYATIGAPYMLRNYAQYPVVDEPSLGKIVESGLSMLVYADGAHDLETVLRHDPRSGGNGNSIGTLIVPQDEAPVLAA